MHLLYSASLLYGPLSSSCSTPSCCLQRALPRSQIASLIFSPLSTIFSGLQSTTYTKNFHLTSRNDLQFDLIFYFSVSLSSISNGRMDISNQVLNWEVLSPLIPLIILVHESVLVSIIAFACSFTGSSTSQNNPNSSARVTSGVLGRMEYAMGVVEK